MNNQHLRTGLAAEKRACLFLQKKGFKLLARNYRWQRGEIDLIMKKKDTIVFIEVRYRHYDTHGSAEESVSINKQKKIIATAKHYLLKNNLYEKANCRFDVIAINHHQLTWHPNSFHAH